MILTKLDQHVNEMMTTAGKKFKNLRKKQPCLVTALAVLSQLTCHRRLVVVILSPPYFYRCLSLLSCHLPHITTLFLPLFVTAVLSSSSYHHLIFIAIVSPLSCHRPYITTLFSPLSCHRCLLRRTHISRQVLHCAAT